MAWPAAQDYNEAVQSPASFADPELRAATPDANALGLPLPRSGNFADVYPFTGPAGRWAVKCFTREVPGLRERYAEVSAHLEKARLPFTVDFRYLEEGIRVQGRWYPVLKMQWVEGLLLNEFVRGALDRPAPLDALLQVWLRTGRRLREADVAHADLQHGNVLLVPGGNAGALALKLIDYDGMWVPALAGRRSGEVGHPAYQHPQRLREATFTADVDRFPLLAVAAALRCLRVGGAALWQRYDNGDNLLFREADLAAPGKSALFRELWRLDDAAAHALVGHLALAAGGPLDRVPLPDKVLPEGKTPALDPARTRRAGALLGAPLVAAVTAPPPVRRRAAPAAATAPESGLPAPAPAAARRTPARRAARLPWVAGGVTAALVAAGLFAGVVVLRRAAREETPSAAAPSAAPTRGGGLVAARAEPAARPREEEEPEPPAGVRWDLPDGPAGLVRGFDGHRGSVHAVAASPAAPLVLSASDDGTLRLWDAAAGGEVRRFEGHEGPVTAAAFSRRGDRAVSAGDDRTVRVWDVATGELLATLEGHEAVMKSVAFSPDGRRLLSGGDDFTMRLWDLDARNQRRLFRHPSWVRCVAFSPDGKRALSACADHKARVWQLGTGQELAELSGHGNDVFACAFFPDGGRALTAGFDGTLRRWDTRSGEGEHTFAGHAGRVWSAALAADGSVAVSTGGDRTVRVWDPESGAELARWEDNADEVLASAVSPFGRFAVTGGRDGAVRLWRLPRASRVAARPASESKPPGKPAATGAKEEAPGAREPVPDADTRAAAQKLVRETFKAEFARRKTGDQLALAATLFQQGKDPKNDAPRRYVCLDEARALAARAGDGAGVVLAADELARVFEVEATPLKRDGLRHALKASRAAARPVAEVALAQSDESAGADDYDAALEFLAVARDAAPAAGLTNRVAARAAEVERLRADYETVRDSVRRLADAPGDAAASLAVGKFECFTKGDWDKGLPRLLAGNDPALKELADRDLAMTTSGEDMAELAGMWHERARDEKDPAKLRMEQRAYYWYRQALPKLGGLTKVQAEKAVQELEKNPRVKNSPLTPFGSFAGTWAVQYANQTKREYVITADGTVTDQDRRQGRLKRRGGSALLDFGDDKLERLQLGRNDRQLLVEHYSPASTFPKGKPVLGVGVKKLR